MTEFGADVTGCGNEQLHQIGVPVRRLDAFYDARDLAGRRALLKIDVQGDEADVLAGIADLSVFAAIEIEIPLVEIYAGSGAFIDEFKSIADRGFVAYTIQSERWRP